MGYQIIDDSVILKDKGITNESRIKAILNGFIKVKIKLIDSYSGKVNLLKTYIHKSDFEIIDVTEITLFEVCK